MKSLQAWWTEILSLVCFSCEANQSTLQVLIAERQVPPKRFEASQKYISAAQPTLPGYLSFDGLRQGLAVSAIGECEPMAGAGDAGIE